MKDRKETLVKPKKVSFVDFQSAIMAPGIIPGSKTLNDSRDRGIEMYVGMDAGFLTVRWKGEEILVPLANIKSIVTMKEEK